MIKANELRIVNWIADHEAGGVFQIESIYKTAYGVYFASYRNGSIRCEVGELEPIPLTEDWLLKLGFEKVKSDYEDAETWDFHFGILYFDMANNAVKINGQYCLSNIPEYLHQLQNLYFALTGEELEMKGGENG